MDKGQRVYFLSLIKEMMELGNNVYFEDHKIKNVDNSLRELYISPTYQVDLSPNSEYAEGISFKDFLKKLVFEKEKE